MADAGEAMGEAVGEAVPEGGGTKQRALRPVAKKAKKKQSKGNWKTIGHEPVNYELHPCVHRWRQLHPKGPCITPKHIRWIILPLSDRMAQLALPLLRRLLALWLEFGDKFPPEMRARLMAFLIENYGLTAEFLEQILEEARKAREPPEPGEKKKKQRKSKSKKKSKNKEKGDKEEKKKEKKPESGLLFKRRKAGKLPLDWPYKMGSKFLLNCIAYLSKDPDEDYNSRASEYFDVQAMAILEQICQYMDMSLPDPERPTQYGETLVIMALNLSDWIAKYVTAPAQLIPDDKVEEYLECRGQKPKPPAKPKKPPPKSKAPQPEETEPSTPPPEPVTEVQRNWNEMKSPVFVPEKSRISKRKRVEEEEDDVGDNDVGYATDTEEYVGVPRWVEPTLDDVKREFLEYINWYNPWEPEFMYLGPRLTPKGVSMYKIWDPDSDDIPNDLRVLNWNQIEYGFCDGYSFIPSPVPQYYPALRPLRPVRLENVERSGIPREVIKKDLRFFSPWYLMKKPLKPLPPVSRDPTGEELEGEFDEETLEDEMHVPEKKPPVKDSPWGDCTMKEQLEILGHIIHMMSSVPDLTLEYVFEQLEEFCEAVQLASLDENPSEENILLMKKRTIILEQYFFNFFGKKFRDYNDRTPTYIRVICMRLAYYIQMLYEYTARILWELQSRPNPPTPVPTPPETPDDPDSLKNLDDWLAWLLRVTNACDEWAGWISETVAEAEKKAAKKKGEFVGPDGKLLLLSADEWFGWKADVESKVFKFRTAKKQFVQESPYYLEKAKSLQPVKHRHKVCVTEGDFEGDQGAEEQDDIEGLESIWDERRRAETDEETEWEDVGDADGGA
ncbi:hypothetical protein RUM44_005999 [Polyplax serrata]|uniref:Uncharacterized protein n=1 Tax=Polyplax serrata TaxID=468196 RepID=A0ABR1B0A5_POLSC